MPLITVPCAVCGGSAFQLLHPSNIPDPESNVARYFSSSRLYSGHLAITRCIECGLVMTNPRDDNATLAHVYSELEDNAYEDDEVNMRRTAREHLAFVASHCNSGRRILDIGCGAGIFVDVAREGGWQATGLETSEWAIQRARRRYPDASFVRGMVEEANFPPASFDAITLWDVLEHVHSPADTLRRLRDWLVEDGWLFLNLPDANSFTARWMGKHWVLLIREHLWYFSPATIGLLLRKNGFELTLTRPNFVRFSLASIAGRLAQYPGATGSLARRLTKVRSLRSLAIRFPMGEMNVAARKANQGE